MLSCSPRLDDDVVAEKLDTTAFLGLRAILLRLADVTDRAGRVFHELNAETNAFNERTDAISRKFQYLQEHFGQSQISSLFDETTFSTSQLDQDVRDQDAAKPDIWARPAVAGPASSQRKATSTGGSSPAGSVKAAKLASPRDTVPSPRDPHLTDYYRKGLARGVDASPPRQASVASEAQTADLAKEAPEPASRQTSLQNTFQRKSFVAKSLQRSKTSWVAQHGPLRDVEAAASKRSITGSEAQSGPLTRAMNNITNTTIRQSVGDKVWSPLDAAGNGPHDSPTMRRLQTVNIPFSQEQALRTSLESDINQRAPPHQSVNMMRSQVFQHEFGNSHTVSLPFQAGQFDGDPGSPTSGYADGETTRDRLHKTFNLATRVAQARGHNLTSTSISIVRDSLASNFTQDSGPWAAGTRHLAAAAEGMPRGEPQSPCAAANLRASQEKLQQAFMNLRPSSPFVPFAGSSSERQEPGTQGAGLDLEADRHAGAAMHVSSSSQHELHSPHHPAATEQRQHPVSSHDPRGYDDHCASPMPHVEQEQGPAQTRQPPPGSPRSGNPWSEDRRPSTAASSQQQYYNPPQDQHLSPVKHCDNQPHFPSSGQTSYGAPQGRSPSVLSQYHDALSPRHVPSPSHRHAQMQVPGGYTTPSHQSDQMHGQQGPPSQASHIAASRLAPVQTQEMGRPLSLPTHLMQGRPASSRTMQHQGPSGQHQGYTGQGSYVGPDPRHPGTRHGMQDVGMGRPGPASGQWSGSGQYDPRRIPSGTPGLYGYSNLQASPHSSPYPPYGAAPQSMVHSGRLGGPSGSYSHGSMGPGQQAPVGRPGPPLHSSSWKQGPQGLDTAGPLSKGRPLRAMSQVSPPPGQRPPSGSRLLNPHPYPPGVQPPHPPGVSPPQRPHYHGPPPPNYPGSGQGGSGGKWQQPGTLPTAGTQASSSPFAPPDWGVKSDMPTMDPSRRPPSQGLYPGQFPHGIVAGSHGSVASSRAGSPGQAQRSLAPGQAPPASPTHAQFQQPPSPVPSTQAAPAAFMQTFEVPAPLGGVGAMPATPSAANIAAMQAQQQPLHRPQTAMSNTSQRTTASVAAAGPAANFYLAAKAVKSGQVSPRSTSSNPQVQRAATPPRPPSAAGSHASNTSQMGMMQMMALQSQQQAAMAGAVTPPRHTRAGSEHLSPQAMPPQADPRRHVMASIDSTSTAAFSAATSRHPTAQLAAGAYPRGPSSIHSSRPSSARPGSSQPSSPPNSQRNTPTIAAARNMANRAASSAATSPAALVGGSRGPGSHRSSPMASPRLKMPDAGMGSLMERARAVRIMESNKDVWGDLGASQDTVASLN